jgi:hypothetical protein
VKEYWFFFLRDFLGETERGFGLAAAGVVDLGGVLVVSIFDLEWILNIIWADFDLIAYL